MAYPPFSSLRYQGLVTEAPDLAEDGQWTPYQTFPVELG